MASVETAHFGDRALELLAALLLGMATVGTAFCVFQAARWNDTESDEVRVAAGARLEASRLFGLGTQKISYDATIAALYAQAVVDGKPELQRFYRENLVRPEFLPIIDEWEDQAAAGGSTPANLLQNEDYVEEQFAASDAENAKAEEALSRGEEASENADDFVQTTIFLASAMFFAGVTANFRSRPVRLLLLSMAAVAVAFGASTIAGLPIA